MGRSFITSFPGPDQSGLGIPGELLVPLSISQVLYAGYVLNSQLGHEPLEDISGNRRHLENIGVDFSRGDYPTMTQKSWLLAPFSGNDFVGTTKTGSILAVVKAPVGINHEFVQGHDSLGSALNNLPDTHAPLLYINAADKVVAQVDFGGSVNNTSPIADSGATGWQLIGWSCKTGDGTVPNPGAIRSYRKRAGQASIYGSSTTLSVLDFGTNPMTIGLDQAFSANVKQIGAAFFTTTLLNQAAFDVAYGEIATLMLPFGITL